MNRAFCAAIMQASWLTTDVCVRLAKFTRISRLVPPLFRVRPSVSRPRSKRSSIHEEVCGTIRGYRPRHPDGECALQRIVNRRDPDRGLHLVRGKTCRRGSSHRDRDGRLSVAERLEIMRRAAAFRSGRTEPLAIESAREGGKPVIDSRKKPVD